MSDINRHTLLASDQPLLVWNAIAGATSYTVRLEKGSDLVWEEIVQETSYHYSCEPALEPSVLYSLTVVPHGGTPLKQIGEGKLEFILLDKPTQQAVQEALQAIDELARSVDIGDLKDKVLNALKLILTLLDTPDPTCIPGYNCLVVSVFEFVEDTGDPTCIPGFNC